MVWLHSRSSCQYPLGYHPCVVFAWLFSEFIKAREKPALEMDLVNQRQIAPLTFERQILVINNGNATLDVQRGYWHLYVPAKLRPCVDLAAGERNVPINEEKYIHFAHAIEYPIFPGCKVAVERLVMVVPNLIEDTEKLECLYYFSAEFGYYPRKVKPISKDDDVHHAEMGKIAIELKGTLKAIHANSSCTSSHLSQPARSRFPLWVCKAR